MRLIQLLEKTQGTFISARLSSDSIDKLMAWIEENKIQGHENREDFHITLVVSKDSAVPYHPEKYDEPLVLDPVDFKIDLFGKDKDVLVLRVESEFLQERHAQLRSLYGLDWDFPEYNPHITICHKPQEIQAELNPPDFPIEVTHETLEAFGK